MILFAADDHFGARSGASLYEMIKHDYAIEFHENDWSCFAGPRFPQDCDLLILNMIAGTGDVALPGSVAEEKVRQYVESGGDLLLLHGSSAAFWHWDWWRPLVGYRWVRSNDPDGVEASTHPKRPYEVTVAKCRHPLCNKLGNMQLPEDEIYINLEQTCPATVLMETTIDEGSFPQCYEARTPWNGRIVGFVPGHRKEAVQSQAMVENCRVLIDYLLS